VKWVEDREAVAAKTTAAWAEMSERLAESKVRVIGVMSAIGASLLLWLAMVLVIWKFF
jgi:hypothetical protein